MKVKKFLAPTMPEVMKKVRNELGSEAVILNSKVVKSGGFMGLFKKNQTEVIAAIDPFQNAAEKFKKRERNAHEGTKEQTFRENEKIMKELKELKSMIQSGDIHSHPSSILEKLDVYLRKQEMDTQLIDRLLLDVQEKYLEESVHPSSEQMKRWTTNEMVDQLKPLSFGNPAFKKRFIHLVGPTGVGKTTTVAKLAAEAVLDRKLKVAFITTDTFRIAAIDQLKTYAEILDVPLEVAYSAEDYAAARKRFKDYDLVLVDTAGRNFSDPAYVEELNKTIDFNKDSETYLVLSLTSKYSDMSNIYHQFDHIPIDKLIYTKADETATFGSALSMVIKNNIGVAYLTNGQNVPDDINEASSAQLIKHVMEGFDVE
ncbi:flagellar biosynthesis protein FlhF [Halobacillus sp. BBL2006]|uniref:flagellar biosynthesis protein FlhF n=1 Tax=Halobacillus sp. BBL2006 TaxID=1543706 RepID=UPI0005440C89|nr:flagellar biosynthesis protein FlhF [Halobacillus sp. BBL2006]KHE71273.1 hypothetical protein LD39_10195 [Halobacillus sp. BBL2006]